jgi:tetratricopeptide (TPR) repeat protein
MEKEQLLDQYEATGEPAVFDMARALYEEAVAADPDNARARLEYGYLLESHGRNSIRAALSHYERAIDLDPAWASPRFELIYANAALRQTDDAIDLYQQRLEGAPDDPHEYRYLGHAYRAAHAYDLAGEVVDAGLKLFPDDPVLVELQGDVCAGTSRPAEALAHWERAHELDPENISPCYSRVFLLQHEHRLEEAADTWRYIIAWLKARDFTMQAEWPERELKRVLGQLAG